MSKDKGIGLAVTVGGRDTDTTLVSTKPPKGERTIRVSDSEGSRPIVITEKTAKVLVKGALVFAVGTAAVVAITAGVVSHKVKKALRGAFNHKK